MNDILDTNEQGK